MEVRGLTADLRWSYLVAATIGPWTLRESVLTGTVHTSDRYRLSQTPLTAVLRIGQQDLTFPVIAVTITGDLLTCQVGPRVRMYEQTQAAIYQ
jgi:hypothetical protein